MSSDAFGFPASSSRPTVTYRGVRDPGPMAVVVEPPPPPQPTTQDVADPESVVAQQPFSGLQLSSQDVADLVEGVDFSEPVLEGEVARPPLRMTLMDILPSASSSSYNPSALNPLPSTSRAMPGPALSCAMPQLGRPAPLHIVPQDASADVHVSPLPSPDPGRFEVICDRERQYRNFETLAREITINIDPPHLDTANPYHWLRDTFNSILSLLLTDDIAPQDRIGFTFFSAARVGQRPIGLSLRRRDQFSIDVLLQLIQHCIQSNEEFLIAGHLRVVFLHVRVPMGGVRNARVDLTSDFHTFCKKKQSIITIDNNDNLCLARALIVAMAFLKKEDSPADEEYYQSVRNGRVDRRKHRQTVEAQRLCREANVDLTVNGGGVQELSLFQQYLNNYCITVFTDRRGRETMFEGPVGTPDNPRLYIDLIYGNNHYNVITSVTGAFTAKSYCRPCKYADSHSITRHICPEKCPACIQQGLCGERARVKCDQCHRSFFGQACYQRHLLPSFGQQSACQTLKKCNTCLHTYSLAQKKRVHICGETLCMVCDKYVPPNHLCYVQPAKPFTPKKPFLFIFFDFECTQETPVPDRPGSFEHVPNLCISEQACPTCVSVQDSEHYCTFCGTRKHVFQGVNTVKDFVAYLAEPRPQYNDVVVIAHNFKAYDGQFVLRHMIEELGWAPELIMSGTKIQSMRYSHLHFIDSLNFLLEGLGKLPKTFNLGDVPKGYFPHFFNKIENANYIGPIPPPEKYGCDDMTVDDRNNFMEWYNPLAQDPHYVFDFQSELLTYCSRDVFILRLACLKFRDSFLKENRVDPFRQSVTIAGACMKVYRTNFIKKDTISVIPAGGYRLADRQSREALCWLMWEAHSRNINIQHAGNGREKKLCGVKVDGYSESGNEKTVWEYHGCWFHGCPICFKNRDTSIKSTPGETMGTRYEKTLDKTELLRRNGYTVIEMWSCQFEIIRKGDPAINIFINSKEEIKTLPIEPRDAFFGGRTNATKLYHKTDGQEKILYTDICSLYPYICKYGVFPMKHPKIHVGDACPLDISNIEGLVKADVLPPNRLYHPVLPTRFNGKLIFCLCRTCAEAMHQGDCEHTDGQRMLTGTWVTCELKKAVSLGYRIIKIYEIWEYKTTKYDRTTKTGGLFAEYINNFLKIKQEASGWPDWCIDEDSKARYVSQYEEREGIKLDPTKIEKNPGLRALSKLLLNAFWGKWGQRSDLPQTTIVKSRSDLLNILTDPGVEVDEIMPVSENLMFVNWHDLKENIVSHPYTNPVVAAFVTAQARLKLYSYLEFLGERVLYFDTDSIVFTQKPGEVAVPTGEFLGDMTSELDKYGLEAYIEEFVSGGAKNYAFKVNTGSPTSPTVCKVRGITMNYRNRGIVNFAGLKDMVINEAPPSVVHIPTKIARSERGVVVTRPETKTYRVVYNKRRRVGEFDTLPYGTKRQRVN